MGLICYTHPDFWKGYKKLQEDIQRLADNKFELFKDNPHHPSLGFAKKGNVWTVDVGYHHRAIGYREGNEIVWFWIGTHEEYNTLMNRL
ncbi:type II toxin-antitoxin system RelE family toxin [Desulfonatronum parangueonense]